MSSYSEHPTDSGASLVSPFERWCETHHVRPEQQGAWEHYQWSREHERVAS